ncbi:hypothetical protein V1512DRAFT_245368 [Lipomyces arxii]|uniref:uncharacterized protein n=1 Tax=Lipomyces arxii TaxID=56418 RepID=UPI0034D000FB
MSFENEDVPYGENYDSDEDDEYAPGPEEENDSDEQVPRINKGKQRANQLSQDQSGEDDEDDFEVDDFDEDSGEDQDQDDGEDETQEFSSQYLDSERNGNDVADDEEVFYLPLDLSLAAQSLDNISKFQIINLHTAHPLISIGNSVYEGDWEDLVGTDMFFNKDAELIGTSREQIRLHPGRLVKKEELNQAGSEGRIGGIDWNKPAKPQSRKLTLLDKIAEIDKKKKESRDASKQAPDVEMADADKG